MTTDFLKAYEIMDLIQLNISTMWHRSTNYYKKDYSSKFETGRWEKEDLYISRQKPDWDRLFFNPILKADPTLEPLVAEFWELAKTEQYIESLAGRLFNGKITIEPISHMLFGEALGCLNQTNRKNFVKRMITSNPELIKELHTSLKSKNDIILLAAYIDLLPKTINLIKDSNKNIFKILENSSQFTESNQTKTLSSICRSFNHTQELYDFIKKQFSPRFETMHTLRETFHNLESKYFSKFKEEKHTFLLESNEIFTYSLKLKDSALVDQFNIHKTLVQPFKLDLFQVLRTIINEQVDKSIYFDNVNGTFSIHTQNFENKDPIKKIMKNLESVLPPILKVIGKDYKHGIEDSETIQKFFKSAILKFNLEESLNTPIIDPKTKSKKTKL
jgi:hypothetical protein